MADEQKGKSTDAGIIMRQAIICDILKDGPKTLHQIGEAMDKRYRRLHKIMTCTWAGGKMEPIEYRLSMLEDATISCRNLERDVGRRDCEPCRNYRFRDVAPASVSKNLDTLIGHGIVAEKYKDNRSVYSLNQGCYNGLVVLKSDDGHLFLCMCPNILCKIPWKGKKREITEDCVFYKYIYAEEPIIKVTL